jgi:Fis family transcriptional regulator
MKKSNLKLLIQELSKNYLKDIDPSLTGNLHKLLLAEVEPILIKTTLKYTKYNKTTAARILGITRNTLRKMIQTYQITSV